MQLWVIRVSIDLAKIWKHRGIDHRSTTVKGDSCGRCFHVNRRNITVFELDIGISLSMLFVQKYTHSITNNTSITNFNFLIIQGIKLKNISSYVPSNEDERSLSNFWTNCCNCPKTLYWFNENFVSVESIDSNRTVRSLEEYYPLIKDKQQLLPQLYATTAQRATTIASRLATEDEKRSTHFRLFRATSPPLSFQDSFPRTKAPIARVLLPRKRFLSRTVYRSIVRPWPGPRYLPSTF